MSSEEPALSDLEEQRDERKSNGNGILQPGTSVPGRLAPGQPHVARAPSPAKAAGIVTSEQIYGPMFIRHRRRAHFRLILEVRLAGEAPAPHGTMPATSALLPKYKYRRRLPHLQKEDAAVFVTFCAGARRVLPEPARDLVLDHCQREAGLQTMAGEGARPTHLRPRIHLYAAVVMPDHVHLLFLPLRDEGGWPFPVVDILQCLKSATAHRINKLLGFSGPLGEEESFDHVLRSDEGLKEKCEYIRQNPVEAGLVQSPEECRWLWIDPDMRL